MKEKIEAFFKDKYLYLHLGAMLAFAFLLYLFVTIFLSVYTNHGEKMPVPDLRGLSLDRAKEIAKEQDMDIVIFDTVYVAGYQKGSIVDHLPKAGFLVKEGRRVFLTLNSDTPPIVSVPDLVDESLRQAISIVENSGLEVGRLIYKTGFKDLVLGQEIGGLEVEPGAKVSKGTKINLIVGKGNSSEKTYLPKLLGLTLAEAKVKIANAGLNLDFIKFDEEIVSREDSVDAVIWRQAPAYKPETQVGIGANMDVWLMHKDMYVDEDETAVPE